MSPASTPQALWLLDTSVVAELIRPRPDPGIRQGFVAHEEALALPSVVWHELLYGVERLPPGQRKEALAAFLQVVPGRLPILPYDQQAAQRHARLRVALAEQGRDLPSASAQVAAIALAHDLTLVTCTPADYAAIPGLRVQDGWD